MSQSLRSFGKCILAGEHSVVRGGEALVLPLRSRSLELSWKPLPSGKMQIAEGPFQAPFREALARALELAHFSLPRGGYQFRIESDIPVQAGLGSSAALAVAVVRFLAAEGATLRDSFALATEVENLFHGKSSGIDVACVLASAPIRYVRGTPPEDLPMVWRPPLYLSDTGLRSSTKECVAKVEKANRPDLDERMGQAVRAAKWALVSEHADRLAELAAAMEKANACFDEWGLGANASQENALRRAGALAVKPTGSGGGGFLLSLWPGRPPAGLGLIPVWGDSSAVP